MLGADSLLFVRTGIARLTLELARALDQHPAIGRFGLLAAGRIRDRDWLRTILNTAPAGIAASSLDWGSRLKAIAARVPLAAHIRDNVRKTMLNRQARKLGGGAVLYHEPNMIAMPYDGPTCVTMNDLFWYHAPHLLPASRRRWIDRNLPRTLRTAQRFVAVSHFTAAEAATHLDIPRSRISVVYEAAAPGFRPIAAACAGDVLHRYGLEDQRYIFTVATLEPRKNLDRLFEAYIGLPAVLRGQYKLVIAGPPGWGDVLRASGRAIASGQLSLLGYVPDADLPALMARCALFAFVPLYEGFGLPVVEAMATGAPVLASQSTATGEVAGDGAVLCDPQDATAIRASLRELLQEPALRARWSDAGQRRARLFSWPATADAMVDVWRDTLASAR